MRVCVLACLALLGALTAGCGEDRGAATGRTGTGTGTTETTPAATGDAVTTVEVRETEFEISPGNPRVPRAGVIAFDVRNDGQAVHALEVHAPAGEVETEELQPGDSETIKVELPAGTYEWYCPVGDHEERGMRGEVTVAGGGTATGGQTETGAGETGGDGY